MADPDLELREGGGVVLLALSAFPPSVISPFSPKIFKGGPSPRSATMQVKCYFLLYILIIIYGEACFYMFVAGISCYTLSLKSIRQSFLIEHRNPLDSLYNPSTMFPCQCSSNIQFRRSSGNHYRWKKSKTTGKSELMLLYNASIQLGW